MKKTILFLIILVGILSCNDKFSLTSPYTIDKEYVKDRYSCFNNNDCDNLKDENLNCDLDDPKGKKCICNDEMRSCQYKCPENENGNGCPQNAQYNTKTCVCECTKKGYFYDKATNKCIKDIHYNNLEFSLGENHTCAIKSGNLFCWGSNDKGKLGIGNNNNELIEYTPKRVGKDTDWLLIANSFDFSCGLRGKALGSDAYLYCWGNESRKPKKIGNMKIWKSIALNNDSIFLLDNKGILYKRNSNFNDNNLRTNPEKKNIDNNSGWQYISVYNSYTCGINKNNKLFCWDKASVEIPVQLGNDNWEKVSCGNNYACGINMKGELFCWGNNNNCKLGTDCPESMNINKPDPTLTIGINNNDLTNILTNIATDSNYTCAIRHHKEFYCWGSNELNEITADKTFHEYLDRCIHENERYDICYSPTKIEINVINGSLEELKLSLHQKQQGENESEDHNTTSYKCILAYEEQQNSDNDNQDTEKEKKLYCWGHNNSGQVGTKNNCSQGYCSIPQEVYFQQN